MVYKLELYGVSDYKSSCPVCPGRSDSDQVGRIPLQVNYVWHLRFLLRGRGVGVLCLLMMTNQSDRLVQENQRFRVAANPAGTPSRGTGVIDEHDRPAPLKKGQFKATQGTLVLRCYVIIPQVEDKAVA